MYILWCNGGGGDEMMPKNKPQDGVALANCDEVVSKQK